MDKKVGVIIFSVFALMGFFLVAGYFTGIAFYGDSWINYDSSYSPQAGYVHYTGGFELLEVYYSYALYIDFILFVSFFLIVMKLAFSKFFEGEHSKKLSVVLSIIFSLALTLWEVRSGLFIIDLLGQYIFFFVLVAIVLAIFFALKKIPNGGVFVISSLYLLFYYFILRNPTFPLFGEMFYQLLYYNYALDRLFELALIIAIPAWFIGLFLLIKGSFKGGGS